MERPNVVELIAELLKTLSIEEIAVSVDKSVATVFKWKKGARNPNKGDYELLLRIKETQVK